jgi:hypothetical protein
LTGKQASTQLLDIAPDHADRNAVDIDVHGRLGGERDLRPLARPTQLRQVDGWTSFGPAQAASLTKSSEEAVIDGVARVSAVDPHGNDVASGGGGLPPHGGFDAGTSDVENSDPVAGREVGALLGGGNDGLGARDPPHGGVGRKSTDKMAFHSRPAATREVDRMHKGEPAGSDWLDEAEERGDLTGDHLGAVDHLTGHHHRYGVVRPREDVRHEDVSGADALRAPEPTAGLGDP